MIPSQLRRRDEGAEFRMNRRCTRLARTPCWLLAALLALSLVSCSVRRSGKPDYYIGPKRLTDATPAAVGTAGARVAAPAAKAAEAPPAAPAGKIDAPPAPAPAAADGPLQLTSEQALLMALENNQGLVVERITPDITRAQEAIAKAVFDPVLTGTIGHERDVGERLTGGGALFDYATNSIVGSAGLEWFLPTGTRMGVGLSTEIDDRAKHRQLIMSRLGMTVSQALLRGAGMEANLASIREARIDTLVSEYQLRGFAQALVADVEDAYWNCVLAKMHVAIFRRSVALAEDTLSATEERIKAGTLSETERVAAQASLARRKERLINAESDMAKAHLRLLRLVNPKGPNPWKREIQLPDPPVVPNTTLEDVEDHVKVALRLRPELNQARLQIKRGDLEVVSTRNGLLPMLNLFASLGKTGYAETFGGSWGNIDGDGYDLLVGVTTAYPLRNHDARARYRQAVLGRRQAEEALANLEQLVQVDVRTAHVEVARATEQITATRATRKFREESLRAEMERLKIGRATNLDVARAHRDLVDSETAEAQAVADYLKALVLLYRLDGSLLERRGIAAPGGEPVADPAAAERQGGP
ncbi:MAG: TolC family protein [Planctomycetes bacterium]|nr:TolC family protein [Planctomycetota bacterium]